MRVQLTRMVAAPIANATTGLAVQLATLALDGTDARPEVPTKIINPADDDAAVTQEGLTDWPLIVVTSEQPSRYTWTGTVSPMRLDVPNHLVTIAYVTRDSVEASQAWRDASYTLHAVLKALLVGLFASGKEAARTRGPLTIFKLNAADIIPTDYKLAKGTVSGALILDLHLRFTP